MQKLIAVSMLYDSVSRNYLLSCLWVYLITHLSSFWILCSTRELLAPLDETPTTGAPPSESVKWPQGPMGGHELRRVAESPSRSLR